MKKTDIAPEMIFLEHSEVFVNILNTITEREKFLPERISYKSVNMDEISIDPF